MPVPISAQIELPRRSLLRDTVRDKIRDAIMDGTLAPGEVLNDKDLQVWLGVSRTPIRDALNELTKAGLVEMEPNRYTRVANPGEGESVLAVQTLGVLYAGVIQLAIPGLSQRTSSLLAEEIERLAGVVPGGDQREFWRLFLPVLELYGQECGNPILVQLCKDSVDGLMFKIRGQRMLSSTTAEGLVVGLRELSVATGERNPARALAATIGIFQLA